MAMCTKENGRITNVTAWEITGGQMVLFTKESGRRVRSILAKWHTKMVESTKVTGRRSYDMGMASTKRWMAPHTLESGRTTCDTAWVKSHMQMAMCTKVDGRVTNVTAWGITS